MGGKNEKIRLDKLLVERRLVESRERAKRLIMAGMVIVDGVVVDKPGKEVGSSAEIRLKEKEKYVSRGGYKIESVWRRFRFDVKGKVACDIGASTGGFTNFLLQMGAKRVYAVDVGRGQLHWKLRNDERVVVLEKFNARYLTEKDLGGKVDLVTCDVSFISVLKILPSIKRVLRCGGEYLVLVKPQFEAPKHVVKKGVVRDPEVHVKVLEKVVKFLSAHRFSISGVAFSEIRGPKGNIEFFVYGHSSEGLESGELDLEILKHEVEAAHEFFRRVKDEK